MVLAPPHVNRNENYVKKRICWISCRCSTIILPYHRSGWSLTKEQSVLFFSLSRSFLKKIYKKKSVALAGFQLQVVVTGWLICGENCRSGNSIQTLSSTNSSTVLCCIMLHCIVLYYVALCCVVLCCTVLCCIMLHCIVLYYVALYCVVLCCIMLYYVALYYVALCCVVQGSLLQQQGAQALTRPRSFCISNDKQDRTQFLTMWLHLNLIWLIGSRQTGKHCTPLSFEAPMSWLWVTHVKLGSRQSTVPVVPSKDKKLSPFQAGWTPARSTTSGPTVSLYYTALC